MASLNLSPSPMPQIFQQERNHAQSQSTRNRKSWIEANQKQSLQTQDRSEAPDREVSEEPFTFDTIQPLGARKALRGGANWITSEDQLMPNDGFLLQYERIGGIGDTCRSKSFLSLPLSIREIIYWFALNDSKQSYIVDITSFRERNKHHYMCTNVDWRQPPSISRNWRGEFPETLCYGDICPQEHARTCFYPVGRPYDPRAAAYPKPTPLFRFPIHLRHPLFRVSKAVRNEVAFSCLLFQAKESHISQANRLSGLHSVWADLRWFLYNVIWPGKGGEGVRRMSIQWPTRLGVENILSQDYEMARHVFELMRDIARLKELCVSIPGHSLAFEWFKSNRYQDRIHVAILVKEDEKLIDSLAVEHDRTKQGTSEKPTKKLRTPTKDMTKLFSNNQGLIERLNRNEEGSKRSTAASQSYQVPRRRERSFDGRDRMESPVISANIRSSVRPRRSRSVTSDAGPAKPSSTAVHPLSSPLETSAESSVTSKPVSPQVSSGLLSRRSSIENPSVWSRCTSNASSSSVASAYSPLHHRWTIYCELVGYVKLTEPCDLLCRAGSFLSSAGVEETHAVPSQMSKTYTVALFPLSRATALELPVIQALAKLRGIKDVEVAVTEGEELSVRTELADWLLDEWMKPREDEVSEKEVRSRAIREMILGSRKRKRASSGSEVGG